MTIDELYLAPSEDLIIIKLGMYVGAKLCFLNNSIQFNSEPIGQSV